MTGLSLYLYGRELKNNGIETPLSYLKGSIMALLELVVK